ncbi:translation initiation factor SUI1 [Exophiala viscosa]|uniref:Translation initiation factor SUI1 n=1 Tax=Exophiala viscosa TaxID=2486360 RepID=A0AAN6DWG4_9EURO|nr:translation initiation factor SUI1 [Exophiala viscosa]KAI1625767.1 translation initiation factor SUI1 [Exophiala viscosa]
MAAKKDMRRTDLGEWQRHSKEVTFNQTNQSHQVIPYVEPKEDKSADFSSTFASTMPMAAMFMRNRMLGWFSLLSALLNWLGETSAQKQSNGTPAYLTFGMAILAVAVVSSIYLLDPFAEADDDTGEAKQSQNYIHIRIQQRNGRKTLTTVQGLPKKFDQKKILKVIKKKFACNGTIVTDSEMGEVIQLQGDQRKDVQEFLVAKDGLELDAKTIKVHGF